MKIGWIDILIVLICIVSGFFSFRKGFIREAFSLIGIIGGIILGLIYAPVIGNNLKEFFRSELLAWWIAFFAILIVTMLIAYFSGFLISKIVSIFLVGWLDRTIGFFFGIIKSIIVIALILHIVDLYSNSGSKQIKKSPVANKILKEGRNLVETINKKLKEDRRWKIRREDLRRDVL